MEQEIKDAMSFLNNKPQKRLEKNISKVPSYLIFSKFAIYKMFNRFSKTETYLNGIQAEALLGLQNSVREKILAGHADAFSTEDAYVKFDSVEV